MGATPRRMGGKRSANQLGLQDGVTIASVTPRPRFLSISFRTLSKGQLPPDRTVAIGNPPLADSPLSWHIPRYDEKAQRPQGQNAVLVIRHVETPSSNVNVAIPSGVHGRRLGRHHPLLLRLQILANLVIDGSRAGPIAEDANPDG